MYLSGNNGCGCGEGLGDYLAGYLGADPAPWYEQLILAGENIAQTAISRPTPQFPTYGPSYTPPMLPSSYPPAAGSGTYAQQPGGLEDYLPWIIGGAIAVYLFTR